MNLKILGLVSLFVVYCLCSGWYYIFVVKDIDALYPDPIVDIMFDRDSYALRVSDSFEKRIALLTDGLADSNSLLLTGLYGDSETNSSDFQDLGIARAQSVKTILGEYIDPNVVLMNSRKLDTRVLLTGQDLVELKILANNRYYKETIYGANVYLSDSLLKKIPVKVDAYITFLVNEYGGRSIEVIGHTDTAGDAGFNFEKGLATALAIKKMMVDKGGEPIAIKASSKGETAYVEDYRLGLSKPGVYRVEIIIEE